MTVEQAIADSRYIVGSHVAEYRDLQHVFRPWVQRRGDELRWWTGGHHGSWSGWEKWWRVRETEARYDCRLVPVSDSSDDPFERAS